MEVYPVINSHDRHGAEEAIAKIQPFSKWVHLDVSDAVFTFNKCWGDPSVWKKIGGDLSLEVHLMVEHPERDVDAWLDAGARRVIVHIETVSDESLALIRGKMKDRAELMLAINPETPVHALEQYLEEHDQFQMLAVIPGPSGQKFLPIVLEKIKFLRREKPNARIEVDGGIDKETGALAKSAGANSLVSASYILNSQNPSAAYEELVRL